MSSVKAKFRSMYAHLILRYTALTVSLDDFRGYKLASQVLRLIVFSMEKRLRSLAPPRLSPLMTSNLSVPFVHSHVLTISRVLGGCTAVTL